MNPPQLHQPRMPNKPRPRCPECEAAMTPVHIQRPRGDTMQRAGETFYCEDHDILAKGRPDDTAFLD